MMNATRRTLTDTGHGRVMPILMQSGARKSQKAKVTGLVSHSLSLLPHRYFIVTPLPLVLLTMLPVRRFEEEENAAENINTKT